MSPYRAESRIAANSVVEALLPNRRDPDLEDIAFTTFTDRGEEVAVTPVDQILASLARYTARRPQLGGVAVALLPRFKHRSALLLAIITQLLCRRAPVLHRGPVVLVGFDIDIHTQLKALGVQGHRRMGLADGNPLSLHRLTRAGELRPVVGPAGLVDQSLVYYNTRVGAPPLRCAPPIVVLDATTVRHPDARRRALGWAAERHARAVLVLADLGDEAITDTIAEVGIVPTVVPLTEHVLSELIANLGEPRTSTSTLSSADVLVRGRTAVQLHLVEHDVINDSLARAYGSLAGRPQGAPPPQVAVATKLLRNATRLAAEPDRYRSACVLNPRPGEMPALHLLERDPRLPRSWRTWGTARLGSLRSSVRELWAQVDTGNPKVQALWRILDHVDHACLSDETSIGVRCHSRAAALATRNTLSSGTTPEQVALWERLEHRLVFTTFAERFEAGSFEAQILTGAPPPWLLSLFLGIEANDTHVLCYDVEAAVLRRQGAKWVETVAGWHAAAARTFGTPPAPAPVSPFDEPEEEPVGVGADHLRIPDLSLGAVLDHATGVIDEPPASPEASDGTHTNGGESVECIAVHLADGRTWWCEDEQDSGGKGATPVLVVTAGGPVHRPVRQLRTGDQIIIPAGDGTESIHARLVAASRQNADVRALDLLLTQFRVASRQVLHKCATQKDAHELLARHGAAHGRQVSHWASGETIAPQEPGDMKAVFDAAGLPCPDVSVLYAVADALRQLHRTLGRFIAAVTSGRGTDAVDRLRELVGAAADELLDEFTVATVDDIGGSQPVPPSTAGRIR